MSPLLFDINIEPLVAAIHMNPNIKGVKDESQIEHEVSIYANNLLAFVSDLITSIPALTTTKKKYGERSGCKINQRKSEESY